jgi:uncharacterized phiE125 gp8 family phage protein
MRPHYKVLTRISQKPLTYQQAADQLRVDSADDMRYIDELIELGCEYVEDVTGIVGATGTFRVTASKWEDLISSGDIIRINRTPLVSVESVKCYIDGTLTTMSANDYRVIVDTEPGMIQPVDAWPEHDERADAIRIEFTAGHNAANHPPAAWRHAVKMLVAHLYEERKPVAFTSLSEIPYTLQNLIEHVRTGGRFA